MPGRKVFGCMSTRREVVANLYLYLASTRVRMGLLSLPPPARLLELVLLLSSMEFSLWTVTFFSPLMPEKGTVMVTLRIWSKFCPKLATVSVSMSVVFWYFFGRGGTLPFPSRKWGESK